MTKLRQVSAEASRLTLALVSSSPLFCVGVKLLACTNFLRSGRGVGSHFQPRPRSRRSPCHRVVCFLRAVHVVSGHRGPSCYRCVASLRPGGSSCQPLEFIPSIFCKSRMIKLQFPVSFVISEDFPAQNSFVLTHSCLFLSAHLDVRLS